MSVPLTLLGLLERGPSHGYDLKRDYDAYFGRGKPLRYSQVYATLSRLARDGKAVAGPVEQEAGPERRRYVITEVGIADVERWLAEPAPPEPDLTSELFAKVVLALMLGRPASSYLDKQRAAHLQRMRELTELKRDGAPLDVLPGSGTACPRGEGGAAAGERGAARRMLPMPDAPSPEPFIPQATPGALEDLRARLRATRWPDTPGDAGWSLGTDLGYLRELVAYWADGFDWPAQEAALARLPRFLVPLGDLRIHFVHARGAVPTVPGPPVLPLVLSHGWPDSFWRYTKVIPLLTDPGAHGADPTDAFDVVVPDMPGYGYSGRPA